MNRSRHATPALALGVALLASGLAGCSAEATSSEAPSSSRLVRPSEIPDVSVSSSDDASTVDGTDASAVATPEQIWIRSASYADKAYHLTLATASAGTFNVYDAQAVGGTNTGPLSSSACTVRSEKPLGARPAGAIAAVSHLVTLDCPAATPMNLPVIAGQWSQTGKEGSSEAIFRLGGADRQGRPTAPSAPPTDPSQKIDGTVVSVKHHGGDLTVRAWVTEYVSLTVGKSEGADGSLVNCTTKALPETRAGVRTTTRQRLFEVRCSKLPSLKGYALSSWHSFGSVGQAPSGAGASTDLTPGAAILG